jgi:5-methyltetrahydropteroyltriglutamate--homocysteine methyltransferase
MGADRELKKANEAYWAGKLSQEDLVKEASRLRQEHWKIQKDAGVDIIPSNDFAFYDHLLDHIQLFNVSWKPSQNLETLLTIIGYPGALL